MCGAGGSSETHTMAELWVHSSVPQFPDPCRWRSAGLLTTGTTRSESHRCQLLKPRSARFPGDMLPPTCVPRPPQWSWLSRHWDSPETGRLCPPPACGHPSQDLHQLRLLEAPPSLSPSRCSEHGRVRTQAPRPTDSPSQQPEKSTLSFVPSLALAACLACGQPRCWGEHSPPRRARQSPGCLFHFVRLARTQTRTCKSPHFTRGNRACSITPPPGAGSSSATCGHFLPKS